MKTINFNSRTWPLITSVALFIASIISSIIYSFYLPETIPTHWGEDGIPDSYSPKITFLITYHFIVFGVGIFLIVLSLVILKIPIKYLNVPNKEIFLKDPVLAKAAKEFISNQMLWFTTVTILFVICIFQLSLELAREESDNLFWIFWILLIAYLMYNILFVVLLIMKFYNSNFYPSSTPSTYSRAYNSLT